METNLQTKNSPYSVMDYNNLLMNMIHGISYNIGLGGTGMEQAHILRHSLKPKYQEQMKKFFDKLDNDYNNQIKGVENTIAHVSLESDRKKLNRKIMTIQRQYSLLIVQEVIAILDRNGALEFTQSVLHGGKDFQKFMDG